MALRKQASDSKMVLEVADRKAAFEMRYSNNLSVVQRNQSEVQEVLILQGYVFGKLGHL